MNVVKNDSSAAWQTAFVERLGERIVAAFDHGKAAGRFATRREWAELAGLSPNYVTTKETQCRRNPKTAMKADEAQRLAEAADVSVRWLVKGEGGMLDQEGDDARAKGRRHFLDNAKHFGELKKAHEFLRDGGEDRNFSGMVDASPKKWADEYEEAFRMWKFARKPNAPKFGAGSRVADEE